MSEALTNTLNPPTSATLTIRVIKNFEYRTVKNLVFQRVDLTDTTVGQLKELIRDKINSTSALKPFRTVNYDTLKVYTKAHGAKTQNLTINLEHDDDWILSDDNATLSSYGAENEIELSFFNYAAYLEYKTHPDVIKWG